MTRARLLLIARGWFLLLIAGSLQPARPGPVHGLHRELHWLAFAVAAWLLMTLARSRRQAVAGGVSVFALGLGLELFQHLIYRNPMEWGDVRDDSLAVLAALAVHQFAVALKRAPGG